MNTRIIVTLLMISLFLWSYECLPLYIHSHHLHKLVVPGLIGASAIGFTGYGVALGASLKKLKDIGDDKDDKDDKDGGHGFDLFDGLDFKIPTIKLDKNNKIHLGNDD